MAKFDIKNTITQKTQQTLVNSYISTEQIKQNIVVLEELKNFIPPLNEEERKQLENNIILNGCKDALLLWETTHKEIQMASVNPDASAYVLVDGHNRYSICKSKNINFNVQVMKFTSLKEVKDYMIDLQLGRRNLTPQQASYFRGVRYNLEKLEKGKYARSEHKSHSETYEIISIENDKSQNETYVKSADNELTTSEKLANEYKVSRATIMRDAEFAAGLNQLTPELRQAVLSGQVKIGKTEIQKLSKRVGEGAIGNLDVLAQQEPKRESNLDISEVKFRKLLEKVLKSSQISKKQLNEIVEMAGKLMGTN